MKINNILNDLTPEELLEHAMKRGPGKITVEQVDLGEGDLTTIVTQPRTRYDFLSVKKYGTNRMIRKGISPNGLTEDEEKEFQLYQDLVCGKIKPQYNINSKTRRGLTTKGGE